MTHTEFYCQTTGDNLNAGSTTADAAAFTYAGGTFVRATGVFTVASGNPLTDGVAVGDWMSVYTTVGATVATCVARITAVDATTITIGAAPVYAIGLASAVSETAAAATAKIGGAWKGPNAAVNFPFGVMKATGKNAAGNLPRVNFKNNSTFQITAAIAHNLVGPVKWQGYTTTPGDLGKATIANVTTTAGYTMLTINNVGIGTHLFDLIFDGTGLTTGTNNGVQFNAERCSMTRVVAHDMRNGGLVVGLSSGAYAVLIECEAYLCNKSSTANTAGIMVSQAATLIRCISHDNLAGDTDGHGFYTSNTGATFIDCIADSNGGDGFKCDASYYAILRGCEAYNNGGNGINCTSAPLQYLMVENCNLVKNTGWGITAVGGYEGVVTNCGFGAGTQANGSGNINTTVTAFAVESGTVNYAANATPWAAPTTGDFRISLAAAKNAGRGSFTQTQSGYTGTVGYPDIGAAQHTGGGGQTSSASAC